MSQKKVPFLILLSSLSVTLVVTEFPSVLGVDQFVLFLFCNEHCILFLYIHATCLTHQSFSDYFKVVYRSPMD